MEQIKPAILATILYSDMFDYPLTKGELWRYLLGKEAFSLREFNEALSKIDSIKERDGFYYLTRKSSLIAIRKKRYKISKKKIEKAQQIIHWLQYIPTIEFAGLSGSLSMYNAEKQADIDLFLITKPQTLWITRFLVLSLLQLKGIRRLPGKAYAKDTICVNMLLDTRHMVFPKKKRNIYTAHEIVQMKPLFVRNHTYQEFLRENKWVMDFLPHAFPSKFTCAKKIQKKHAHIKPVEYMAKILQLWYMQKHRTKEVIEDGFVAFHPNDYAKTIISTFEKKKRHYGI